MLLHYHGGTIYPADMSYLGLAGSLRGYEEQHCPADTLGAILKRRLSPAERETLLSLLPRPTAARIRDALAAVP